MSGARSRLSTIRLKLSMPPHPQTPGFRFAHPLLSSRIAEQTTNFTAAAKVVRSACDRSRRFWKSANFTEFRRSYCSLAEGGGGHSTQGQEAKGHSGRAREIPQGASRRR